MYQLVFPAEPLLPYIENYWSVYPAEGETVDLRVNAYVDARADLVFNFGAAYLRNRIGYAAQAYQDSNLDAQRIYPITIVQQGAVAIVGVRFRTGGLAPFTRLPMVGLTNTTSALDTVFGPDVLELEAALRQAGPQAEQQKHLLDTWLLGWMNLPVGFEKFQACKQRIEASGGSEPVESLCASQHLSIRQLDRLFRQHLGFSPKTFAKIMRFQKALNLLMKDTHVSLAQVAQTCAYYDQSHFVKDFKAFTGGVPRGYKGYYPTQGPDDFAPNVVQFLQDEATD